MAAVTMPLLSSFCHLFLWPALICAAIASPPLSRQVSPTIVLDSATFTGVSNSTTGVTRFLGIPFAQPPTGSLRFQLPQALPPYTGTFEATSFGTACYQQPTNLPLPASLPAEIASIIVNEIDSKDLPASEDCLFLNVWQPTGVSAGAALPVVAWIFGGGFEYGDTSSYDCGVIVARSIELGEPVVCASMNYRVSAFGFLASKEVKEAGVGNLGLQDQRFALRWVQQYISSFGGDPTRVTIWGESAGAISVAMQMLANGGDTEGLFHAAFMQSGSPIPTSDATGGQATYDTIVDEVGCSGSADTLNCLRQVPYDVLATAVDFTPNIFSEESLNLTWLPRVDGTFLTDLPQNLVLQGKVANIPFISGDCDDEGTAFSLALANITTEAEYKAYLATNYFPTAPESDIEQLLTLYPQDPAQGSPFGTGDLNQFTPEFKRLAAIQGDMIFQVPRRFFVQQMSSRQNVWSFLSKRMKALPILGSYHGSDISNVFGPGDMTDYLVSFINHLEPTNATGFVWPQYTTSSPQMLTFQDGSTPLALTTDNYRQEAMAFMEQMIMQFP